MPFYEVKLSILGFYLSDFGSTFYSDRGVYFAKMCQKCISYVLESFLGDFYENRKLIPKGLSQCAWAVGLHEGSKFQNRTKSAFKLANVLEPF